ncbi:MAG: Bifunctional thiamine biosynthesis protein ThiDN [Methanoregulaceae archaeon PtaB.Bin152]|nr:MAG: Bifunctional thiamine biosynthesis protein ThiDN [Methanoregulaceae archaeon PtaB.Bin152]
MMSIPGDDRESVLRALQEGVHSLCLGMDVRLIPEVGSNIAYALPAARDPGQVAAVQGRIVRLSGRPHPVGEVSFGASDHVARIVLTAMRFDPQVRCAANIAYAAATVRMLEDMLLEVRTFDRSAEPPGVKTMDWGVASCCRDGVPDVIYDLGSKGKEPMIRLLGENPDAVVKNILKVSARMNKE